MWEIDETANYINSLDVINRIADLQDYKEAWFEFLDSGSEEEPPVEPFSREDQKELDELMLLREQCDYGDFKCGTTLISESIIEQWIEQEVFDTHPDKFDLPSYLEIQIDFDLLKQDYTEVDFRGYTFFLRV